MKRRSRTRVLESGEGTKTANAEAVKAARNSAKEVRAVARIAVRVASIKSGLNAKISAVINRTSNESKPNNDQPW